MPDPKTSEPDTYELWCVLFDAANAYPVDEPPMTFSSRDEAVAALWSTYDRETMGRLLAAHGLSGRPGAGMAAHVDLRRPGGVFERVASVGMSERA